MLLKRAEGRGKRKNERIVGKSAAFRFNSPFFPISLFSNNEWAFDFLQNEVYLSVCRCVSNQCGYRCVATSRWIKCVVFMLAGVMPRTIRILDHTSKTLHWHTRTHQHAVVCSLTETWQRHTHLRRHRKVVRKFKQQVMPQQKMFQHNTVLCCRLQRFFGEIQQLYFRLFLGPFNEHEAGKNRHSSIVVNLHFIPLCTLKMYCGIFTVRKNSTI